MYICEKLRFINMRMNYTYIKQFFYSNNFSGIHETWQSIIIDEVIYIRYNESYIA